MTKARTASTTKIQPASGTDRQSEALSWVTRQLRFEQLLGSLEGRAAR